MKELNKQILDSIAREVLTVEDNSLYRVTGEYRAIDWKVILEFATWLGYDTRSAVENVNRQIREKNPEVGEIVIGTLLDQFRTIRLLATMLDRPDLVDKFQNQWNSLQYLRNV